MFFNPLDLKVSQLIYERQLLIAEREGLARSARLMKKPAESILTKMVRRMTWKLQNLKTARQPGHGNRLGSGCCQPVAG